MIVKGTSISAGRSRDNNQKWRHGGCQRQPAKGPKADSTDPEAVRKRLKRKREDPDFQDYAAHAESEAELQQLAKA